MSVTIGAERLDPPVAFDEQATRVSGRRFLAHFLDGLIYTVALFAVIVGIGLGSSLVLPESAAEPLITVLLVLGFTIGHIWFLVVLHGSDGRTPGKHAAGIRVVDAQGNPPSRGALWRRSTPIIVEYFYVIAWAGMMASPYRQRFGDRWGKTYVIAD